MPPKRRKPRPPGATARPRNRERKGTILRRIEKQLKEEAKQKALSQAPLQETVFEITPPRAEPRYEVQPDPPDPLAWASLHGTVNHALEPTNDDGNGNSNSNSNIHCNDVDDNNDDDEHWRPPLAHAVDTLQNRRIAIGVYFERVLKSPPESLWRKFETISTISDVFREDRNIVRKVCKDVLHCQQHCLTYTGKANYKNREASGGNQSPVATASRTAIASVGHSVTPEGNPKKRLKI